MKIAGTTSKIGTTMTTEAISAETAPIIEDPVIGEDFLIEEDSIIDLTIETAMTSIKADRIIVQASNKICPSNPIKTAITEASSLRIKTTTIIRVSIRIETSFRIRGLETTRAKIHTDPTSTQETTRTATTTIADQTETTTAETSPK